MHLVRYRGALCLDQILVVAAIEPSHSENSVAELDSLRYVKVLQKHSQDHLVHQERLVEGHCHDWQAVLQDCVLHQVILTLLVDGSVMNQRHSDAWVSLDIAPFPSSPVPVVHCVRVRAVVPTLPADESHVVFADRPMLRARDRTAAGHVVGCSLCMCY